MTESATPYVETGTHPKAAIYRSAAITTDHISRFVQVLVREIIKSGVHLDAVPAALIESGIVPMPSPRRCNDIHLDTQAERVNALADALLTRTRRNVAVHAALVGVATAVISELTRPAPLEHLPQSCINAYVRCTSTVPNADHILISKTMPLARPISIPTRNASK